MKTAIRKVRNTLAGLLVLAMLAGVSGSVYAENTGVLDSVAAGTTLDINAGRVNENFGIIATNARNDSGPAVVVTNGETGTVKRNDGVILTNQGTVGVDKNEMPPATDNSGPPSVGNFGTIEVNEGTVHFNKGNIGTRNENGEPVEGQGNFGYVEINGGGTVTINHERAIVDNNHGTIEVNDGTVNENYRYIGVNNNEVRLNGQETFDDGENLGVIMENNATVVTNQGRIVDNRGDVITNKGTVRTNNGKVSENVIHDFYFLDNGEEVKAPGVEVNNGTIETSSGSVDTNFGFIGAEDENGLMKSGNTGDIRTNEETGIVFNLTGGIVWTNNGTVYNYGGTIKARGTGTEFFSVEIVNNTQNTSFSTSGLEEAYGRQWLGQTGETASTATILLIPKDGCEITDVTGLASNVKAEKNNDGTWTLTITSGTNTEVDVPESAEKAADPDASDTPETSDTPEPSEMPDTPETTDTSETQNPSGSVQDPVFVPDRSKDTQTIQEEIADFRDEYSAARPAGTSETADNPIIPVIPDTTAGTENIVIVTATDTKGNQETVAYTIETVEPAAQDTEAAVIVTGTDADTETAINREVEEVLTTGTESTAFEAAVNPENEDYNETFAEAAESVCTIGAGTVDFGDTFANAEEATIEVPVAVEGAQAGQEYTVVLSNGETVTVVCEKDGELVIPFPKDASNLSYVVQNDYASRYADLIESYLLYGNQVLAGRSPETQAFVRAYAAALNN